MIISQDKKVELIFIEPQMTLTVCRSNQGQTRSTTGQGHQAAKSRLYTVSQNNHAELFLS